MLQKKILLGTLLAVSTLGACAVASADTSPNPGLYLGIQGGWGRADYGNVFQSVVNQFPSHSNDRGQYAGRAYAGYQFNPFLSLESGYSYFQNNTFDGKSPIGNVSFTEKTQVVDIVGKASLPFSVMTGCDNPVSAYVKAGGAYVMSKVDESVSGIFAGSASMSDNEFKPTAGAGFEFNFTPNFSADISYSHIFGSDTTASDIVNNTVSAPTTDMVAIGLRYLFDLTGY
jgi:opacity protein-like surface antigen